MRPRMIEFFEGWAAMADTWMVCAFTHDEALRRYHAADVYGQAYPKRLPEWVNWACWLAAVYMGVVGVLDEGGRANAALFCVLATLGVIAHFARPEFFVWAGFAAELCWLGDLYWRNRSDQLMLGWVMAAAVSYWLAFWIERWLHVRRRLLVLVSHRRAR